jgi:hypothetical protein
MPQKSPPMLVKRAALRDQSPTRRRVAQLAAAATENGASSPVRTKAETREPQPLRLARDIPAERPPPRAQNWRGHGC